MNTRLLSAVAALALAAPFAADAADTARTAQTTRTVRTTSYAHAPARTFLGFAGPYVALDLGVSSPEDIDGTASLAGVGSTDFEADVDSNLLGSVAFGVRVLPQVRGEVEFGYRNLDLRDGSFGALGVVPGTANDAEAYNYMANAYYDFDFGQRFAFVPYVMGGLGAATVDADGADSDTVFAYQLGAGVSFPVTDTVAFHTGYRYLDTSDFTLDDSSGSGASLDGDLQEHQFRAGLRFEF